MTQGDVNVISFTSKLKIEGTQGYAEGLKYREWEGHIHIKILLSYSTKLHVDPVVIEFIDQLEVFHRCLVNAAVEVKHESLHLYTYSNYS